jgi:siroheme synthase
VVTGHCLGDDRVDWEALARMDTLLILMGLSRLPVVADQLLAHGRSIDTPAAVISRGTLPDERVVVTTLGGLAETVTREGLATPALVVVGEVVRLRDRLCDLSRRPATPQPMPVDGWVPRPERGTRPTIHLL